MQRAGMDPERARRARITMGLPEDPDASPCPRKLPAWNWSVLAILELERQLNDGHQPSLDPPEWWPPRRDP